MEKCSLAIMRLACSSCMWLYKWAEKYSYFIQSFDHTFNFTVCERRLNRNERCLLHHIQYFSDRFSWEESVMGQFKIRNHQLHWIQIMAPNPVRLPLEYPEPSSAVFGKRSFQLVFGLLLSLVLALPFSLPLSCPLPFALEGAWVVVAFAGCRHGGVCHVPHHPSLPRHESSLVCHPTDGD